MLTLRSLVASLALVASARSLGAQDQKLDVVKLADGVYGSIYSEMRIDPVESNSMFIITSEGVVVVDGSYTPAAARKTIAAIRQLTQLPVRYVIATHWHDDHIFGNQAYREAFPAVQFVAQEHARESMVKGAQQHQRDLVASYSKTIPAIEARLARGTDSAGVPFTAEYRAKWQHNVRVFKEFLANVRPVQVVLPTITFDRQLTLRLGGREIRVMNFGRGNTLGDAVIFLPADKIVAVGDLVVWPVPYIYGGFPDEWSRIMQSVKDLGAATIVPGHGPVMHDTVYMDQVTELLKSLASQVQVAVKRGLTLEETRKVVDLEAFRLKLVQGDPDRADTFSTSIIQSGIQSAYKEAKGPA